MDSLKISQSRGEISPLPKEINEILSNIMSKAEKLSDNLSLMGVELVEVNPTGSPHRRNFKFGVGLDHLR